MVSSARKFKQTPPEARDRRRLGLDSRLQPIVLLREDTDYAFNSCLQSSGSSVGSWLISRSFGEGGEGRDESKRRERGRNENSSLPLSLSFCFHRPPPLFESDGGQSSRETQAVLCVKMNDSLPLSLSHSVTLKFIPAFCRHSANGRRTDLHSTAVHVQCPLLSTQPSVPPSLHPFRP